MCVAALTSVLPCNKTSFFFFCLRGGDCFGVMLTLAGTDAIKVSASWKIKVGRLSTGAITRQYYFLYPGRQKGLIGFWLAVLLTSLIGFSRSEHKWRESSLTISAWCFFFLLCDSHHQEHLKPIYSIIVLGKFLPLRTNTCLVNVISVWHMYHNKGNRWVFYYFIFLPLMQ